MVHQRYRDSENTCLELAIILVALAASIFLGVCLFLALVSMASGSNDMKTIKNQNIVDLQNVDNSTNKTTPIVVSKKQIVQNFIPIDIETTSKKKPIKLVKVSLARKGRLLRRQTVGLDEDD